MLIRKMLRDVWKNKVPFIAIFFMMFIANFVFSGITAEYNGMNTNFSSYLEQTNFADAWVYGNNFNDEDIEKLRKSDEISEVEKRMLIHSTVNGNQNKSMDVYVLDNELNISKPKVSEGKRYSGYEEGIWLDNTFAKENNYKIHDKIKIDFNGKTLEFEIIGLCYSPDYIYQTKEGEIVPDHKNTGFAYLNKKSIQNVEGVIWNQLLLKGEADIEKAVNDILNRDGLSIITKNDNTNYTMLRDEIAQHREIGLIFVATFLFIAILITITTVHRLLSSQQLQIGILKALGFKRRSLYIHYISHSVFVCFVGSLSGWIGGYYILPNIILPLMEQMYIVPKFAPVMLSGSWLLPLGCTFLCLAISAIVCKKYLKGNAAQILYSNTIQKKYNRVPFNFIIKNFSFYVQWNTRDIYRNKLRSIMTIFGVIGCVALVFSATGVYTSMNNMSSWAFDKVQTYNIKINGTFTDENFKNDILKEIYGEELMEGNVELSFENKKDKVSFTGIETQDFIRLYDENKKVELNDGIALSKKIAEKMDIQEGDRIRWRFIGDKEWHMNIVEHIIRTPMSQGITMMKNEMEKENIPFVTTALIGDKIADIDSDNINITNVQNKGDLKAGLKTVLDASIMICIIFLIAAVLLGSIILYNLGSLSYMERYRDMATLKVLGFNNKRIRKLMIQQNIWLTILGIGIGVPVGYFLLLTMIGTVQDSVDIKVFIPWYVYILSILGTFFLSFIINKILSRKVCHIDMVAALKASE